MATDIFIILFSSIQQQMYRYSYFAMANIITKVVLNKAI